jgi:hypothetical protein
MTNLLFRFLLPLAVMSAGLCALFLAPWFLTSGERELKREMRLIRKQVESIAPCSTEFHWKSEGIAVVVLGMTEETKQDEAIQWINERKAEGLFQWCHQIEFVETDSSRQLIRKVGFEP